MPSPEKALIRRLRKEAGHTRGIFGIGDDCSVIQLPAGHEILITTDLSLEGVHFNRKWQPAASIGHRCLLRGLSDIAAMGGKPMAAFLSLALPDKVEPSWVDEFFKGLLNLCRKFQVSLAGGDISKSLSNILADIVILGSVPAGKAILRSGARVNDRIFVTGTLGENATILGGLRAKRKLKTPVLNSYLYPLPRIEVGRVLREKNIASSMIDISDALSSDLAHICEESGVGAEIIAEAIPLPPRKGANAKAALKSALHGGEDYELLFTASPGSRVPKMIANVPITEIGRITRGGHLHLLEKGKRRKLSPGGWEHFKH